MIAAVIREAREEIAMELDREDLEMVTAIHCRNPEGQARVGFFFRARRWRGEPRNAEPHNCSQIAWFPTNSLPDDTVPYTHAGVALYSRDERFGLQGWPHPAVSALERGR
jgi:ADP-ribose pyrophosphatase YjhB (NUDIX family)